jgi:transposase
LSTKIHTTVDALGNPTLQIKPTMKGCEVVIPSRANRKQDRAIATRDDKTARNFLGAIHLAAAMVFFC